jgi:hypothetical protein
VFGCVKKSTRYNDYHMVEPEKALLDWIYLNRQEGLLTPLDELNLHLLDLKKLLESAVKYPTTVNEIVRQLVIDHSLAALAKTAGLRLRQFWIHHELGCGLRRLRLEPPPTPCEQNFTISLIQFFRSVSSSAS